MDTKNTTDNQPKGKYNIDVDPNDPLREQRDLEFEPISEEDDPTILDINVEDYGNLFGRQSADSDTLDLQRISGIHGMPYQWMSSTDIKISDMDEGFDFPYGRTFTDKIINRMPLLLMSPGSPKFLSGFSKRTKEGVVKSAADAMIGEESDLDNILENKEGRYYTHEFNYKEYYEYVNGMCWASAIYLGLTEDDHVIDGQPYTKYDWSTYVNDGLKGFFTGAEYVCFYIDAETQLSENFSNTTGPSALEGMMGQASDMAKEFAFLLGMGAGVQFDAIDASKYDATYEQVSKIVGKYTNPAHVFERLKQGGITVMAGGSMIFPEIWNDSYFNKSYNVTIKLVSPDGDTESIYRNILVPMWHLLGFVLPIQMGPNGYRSPFLVKAYYKGIINCDMGIVTDMSIQKGGRGSWNIDGLPTEVEVNMTIKDLYNVMSMTKWTEPTKFINNTPFLDFIANSCGVVLSQPEIMRKVTMMGVLYGNKVTKVPRNIQMGLNQTISRILSNFMGH